MTKRGLGSPNLDHADLARRLRRLRRRRSGQWRAFFLWLGGGVASAFGELAEGPFAIAASVFVGAGLFLAGYYDLEKQSVDAARDIEELAEIEAEIEAAEVGRDARSSGSDADPEHGESVSGE